VGRSTPHVTAVSIGNKIVPHRMTMGDVTPTKIVKFNGSPHLGLKLHRKLQGSIANF
jgi:hypothetical protein